MYNNNNGRLVTASVESDKKYTAHSRYSEFGDVYSDDLDMSYDEYVLLFKLRLGRFMRDNRHHSM